MRRVAKYRSAPQDQALQLVDDEFVPLSVAATITYFHVTESLRRVSSEADLAEIVHLVAIALSTVAPLYRDAELLSSRELEEILFRPLGQGAGLPALECVSIRRGDLRAAMSTLKQARVTFGRRR